MSTLGRAKRDAHQGTPAEGPCPTALTCWWGAGGRLFGGNPPFPVLLHQLWTLFLLQPFDELVESGGQGQHCPITLRFLLQPVWVQLLLCLECPRQESGVRGRGAVQLSGSCSNRKATAKSWPSLWSPLPYRPFLPLRKQVAAEHTVPCPVPLPCASRRPPFIPLAPQPALVHRSSRPPRRAG